MNDQGIVRNKNKRECKAGFGLIGRLLRTNKNGMGVQVRGSNVNWKGVRENKKQNKTKEAIERANESDRDSQGSEPVEIDRTKKSYKDKRKRGEDGYSSMIPNERLCSIRLNVVNWSR